MSVMSAKRVIFKKKENIVYPRHGAGKVIDICTQIVAGAKQKYYRLTFLNSSVTISVPVSNASKLGLRHPRSKTNVKKILSTLGNRRRISSNTLKQLDTITKENLDSGGLEDAVILVNILKSLAKQKEEENKNFSYSYSTRLEVSMDFIRSEALLVLGKRAIEKYGL